MRPTDNHHDNILIQVDNGVITRADVHNVMETRMTRIRKDIMAKAVKGVELRESSTTRLFRV